VNCRLCGFDECIQLPSGPSRSFFHCPRCQMVGVPSIDHISPDEEKFRYSFHDNQADNPQYHRYCEGIADKICAIATNKSQLLDFGSGPDFVLTRVLRLRGLQCDPYDPVYDLGVNALSSTYDVIILCETIEHLRDLTDEVCKLRQMSKPEGCLFIQTQLYTSKEDVPAWWYAVDTTHINFFNETSLNYFSALLQRRIFYSYKSTSIVFDPLDKLPSQAMIDP
jgi:hypothetical protein